MITVEAYNHAGHGFSIDAQRRWHPVALPHPTRPGIDAVGYGANYDGAFIALYAEMGSCWVQLDSRRWPLVGSAFSIDRRGDRIALVVHVNGQKADELEYSPGWSKLPDEMLLEDADLGEEHFDLGCLIAQKSQSSADVSAFVRQWSGSS